MEWLRITRITVLFTLALFADGCSLTVDQDKAIPSKGDAAQTDDRISWEVFKVFSTGNDEQKEAKLKEVQAAPANYAPPVLYAMSAVLFEKGKKREAAFWFYCGRLRGRYDAARCADVSARDEVVILDQCFDEAVRQKVVPDLPDIQALARSVVDWDRKTPHHYDNRWFYSHGMGAVLESMGLADSNGEEKSTSLPKEQWEEIAEKTRKEFLEGLCPFSDSRIADLADAARDGNIERIDKLVSQGVDVNARGTEGFTPLMYAMSGKTTKGFQRLLEHKADPNLQTERGESVVSFAAARQDSDFLKISLAHGGNPNIRSPFTERNNTNVIPGVVYVDYSPTPIFKAIDGRNPENARILIKAGADLNVRDSDGRTPLISAALIRSYDVMYVLLEAGADYRAKTPDGYPVSYFLLEADNIDSKSKLVQSQRKCMEFMEKKGVDFEKEKLKNAEIGHQIEEKLKKKQEDKGGDEKEGLKGDESN